MLLQAKYDINKNKSKYIATVGILTSLAILLGAIENQLPSVALNLPGIKLGLANIIILYVIENINLSSALIIAAAKSFFVLVTRGAIAFALSFSGGFFASLCMALFYLLIYKYLHGKMSLLSVSVVGAVMHNLAQLMVFALLMKTDVVFYYIPYLILAGVIMGCVTGAIYKSVMYMLRRIHIGESKL